MSGTSSSSSSRVVSAKGLGGSLKGLGGGLLVMSDSIPDVRTGLYSGSEDTLSALMTIRSFSSRWTISPRLILVSDMLGRALSSIAARRRLRRRSQRYASALITHKPTVTMAMATYGMTFWNGVSTASLWPLHVGTIMGVVGVDLLEPV